MNGAGPLEPPISFDRVAPEYDATRALPEPAAAAIRAALLERVRGDRLLDAGVGTGRWAGPLAAAGVRVVGVDVSARMMGVARGRGVDRLLRADVRRLPFRDGAFDTVMSNHLLHLVRPWAAALAEFARVGRRRYLTVLTREIADPDPSERYRALAAERGFSVDSPGLAERRLPDRLRPDREAKILQEEERPPLEELLDPVARRCYRFTWILPDEVHAEILTILRREFASAAPRVVLEASLAEWSTDRLRAFADRELRRTAGAGPGPA